MSTDEKQAVSVPEGQELVPQNLNDGGVDKEAKVFLTYTRGQAAGSPITQLTFIDSEKAKAPAGFHKLDYDISRGQANKPLFLCFKRGTPIKEVRLTAAQTRAEAYVPFAAHVRACR
jgi:hypothetical protein